MPALVKALTDSDLRVRVSAAQTLGHFGPVAANAVEALTRFSAEESKALKSLARSREHIEAKATAERALDDITERALIYSSKWRSPENPYGKRPSTQEARLQIAVENEQTNGPPGNELTPSAACKYVATELMLMEATYCAEQLRLPTSLPVKAMGRP